MKNIHHASNDKTEQILRLIIKSKSCRLYMKSNETQSKEVSLTIDALLDMTANAWNDIKSSKLSIRVDPI